jgi:hypothetical protein
MMNYYEALEQLRLETAPNAFLARYSGEPRRRFTLPDGEVVDYSVGFFDGPNAALSETERLQDDWYVLIPD